MTDARISQLTAASALTATMEFPVNDAGTTKKITPADMLAFLQAARGMPQVKALSADRTIATTAGSLVSDLEVTLPVGAHIVNYYLLMQSATATVSPTIALNFTGTAAVRHFIERYPATGTTASSGTADDVGAQSGQIHESIAFSAFGTSANIGPTGGVATTNTPILYVVEGVLVVTASGNLRLYHGSETATNTTMKAGSSLMVVRTS